MPSATEMTAGDRPASANSPSAVQRVVAALREASLAVDSDVYLGQEPDLVARFGVGRSTFRQAAQLVINEQLIRVKTGAGGGYYSARPEASAVTHMAAIFLHAHGSTLREILEAAVPIRTEFVQAAVRNGDNALRDELYTFIMESRANWEVDVMASDILRSDDKFYRIISTARNNKLLTLYFQIAVDLLSSVRPEGESAVRTDVGRMLRYAALREEIALAIIDRDLPLALAANERLTDLMLSWL